MTDSTELKRLDEWLRLIQSDFSDAPHLRVTLHQAADLWHLEHWELQIILETFVHVGFLHRSIDGAYSRRWSRAGGSPAAS